MRNRRIVPNPSKADRCITSALSLTSRAAVALREGDADQVESCLGEIHALLERALELRPADVAAQQDFYANIANAMHGTRF